MKTWNHRARPEPGYLHGACRLDHGSGLECDAMYFPTRAEAMAWVVSRGWKSYVLKEAKLAAV